MLAAASGMMFAAPTPLRAVQYLIPIPCPLFAPSEGLGAGLANLLRQQCLAVLGQAAPIFFVMFYARAAAVKLG